MLRFASLPLTTTLTNTRGLRRLFPSHTQGLFIGFGAFLAASVGGACPGLAATNPGLQKIVTGAFGLPFGLLMVLTCGAELFTGNTALVTAAVYEGKVRFANSIVSCYIASHHERTCMQRASTRQHKLTAGSRPAARTGPKPRAAVGWIGVDLG